MDVQRYLLFSCKTRKRKDFRFQANRLIISPLAFTIPLASFPGSPLAPTKKKIIFFVGARGVPGNEATILSFTLCPLTFALPPHLS